MRTIIGKGITALPAIRAGAALIALMPLLGACASTGFYIMSDEWCSTHPDASAAHCPENAKARAPGGGDPSLTASRGGESSQRDSSAVSE
jgi:hypothetical protein